jgi:hypothetical protein
MRLKNDAIRPTRTIDFALITLVTYSACQLGNTLFSVDSDCHRLVMMTEQASEGGVYGTSQLRQTNRDDLTHPMDPFSLLRMLQPVF